MLGMSYSSFELREKNNLVIEPKSDGKAKNIRAVTVADKLNAFTHQEMVSSFDSVKISKKVTNSVLLEVEALMAGFSAEVSRTNSSGKETAAYNLYLYYVHYQPSSGEALTEIDDSEFNKVKSALHGDISKFYSSYGDSYVREVIYGKRVVVVAKMSCKSEVERKEIADVISGKLKVKAPNNIAGANVGAKHEVTKDTEEKYLSTTASVSIRQVGMEEVIDLPSAMSLEALIKAFQFLSKKVAKTKVKPGVVIYSEYILYRDFFASDFKVSLDTIKEYFDIAGKLFDNIHKCLKLATALLNIFSLGREEDRVALCQEGYAQYENNSATIDALKKAIASLEQKEREVQRHVLQKEYDLIKEFSEVDKIFNQLLGYRKALVELESIELPIARFVHKSWLDAPKGLKCKTTAGPLMIPPGANEIKYAIVSKKEDNPNEGASVAPLKFKRIKPATRRRHSYFYVEPEKAQEITAELLQRSREGKKFYLKTDVKPSENLIIYLVVIFKVEFLPIKVVLDLMPASSSKDNSAAISASASQSPVVQSPYSICSAGTASSAIFSPPSAHGATNFGVSEENIKVGSEDKDRGVGIGLDLL